MLRCAGMNSGVLLLRNNEWTRDFMNEMMRYGKYPVNFTLEDVSPWLVRLLPPHGFFTVRAFCSGVHGAALITIVTVQELRAGLPSYEVRAYTPALRTCIELMAHALSKNATGRMHLCLLLYCLCKCWWRPQADICGALSCGAEHGQLQQSQGVHCCVCA